MFRGKCIASKAYIKKDKSSKTQWVKFLHKKLEKGDQIIPNIRRRKKIKTRSEINEIETEQMREENQWNQKLVLYLNINKLINSNKTDMNINEIYQPLAWPINKKKKKWKITNIRNKRGKHHYRSYRR